MGDEALASRQSTYVRNMIPVNHAVLLPTLLQRPSDRMSGRDMRDQALTKLKSASYTGWLGTLQAKGEGGRGGGRGREMPQ